MKCSRKLHIHYISPTNVIQAIVYNISLSVRYQCQSFVIQIYQTFHCTRTHVIVFFVSFVNYDNYTSQIISSINIFHIKLRSQLSTIQFRGVVRGRGSILFFRGGLGGNRQKSSLKKVFGNKVLNFGTKKVLWKKVLEMKSF